MDLGAYALGAGSVSRAGGALETRRATKERGWTWMEAYFRNNPRWINIASTPQRFDMLMAVRSLSKACGARYAARVALHC